VRVATAAELDEALGALGVATGPVLVIVGGADGLRADDVTEELTAALGSFLQRGAVAVIDGGTDSGVMRMTGSLHGDAAAWPLVGVAAQGTVTLDGTDAGDGRAPLEPRHTGFLLVPGDAWGDESRWISAAADALAAGSASATLLINGGPVSEQDVRHSVEAGRPVFALRGTGRLADAIEATAMVHPILLDALLDKLGEVFG
jgi:hypothetical protein